MSKNIFSIIHDPLDYKPDWKSMSAGEKLRYIWDYEKVPVAIVCIIIGVIAFMVYRFATYTNPILYAASINITMNVDLIDALQEGYLTQRPAEIKKRRDSVVFDSAWYLDIDQAGLISTSSQVTQVKLMAGVAGHMLDLVLTDPETFDTLSMNGFLLDLDGLPVLQEYAPCFVRGSVLLEQNEPLTGSNAEIEGAGATTDGYFGIDLSDSSFCKKAGFTSPVYLGIINNTQRLDEAAAYVDYLFNSF